MIRALFIVPVALLILIFAVACSSELVEETKSGKAETDQSTEPAKEAAKEPATAPDSEPAKDEAKKTATTPESNTAAEPAKEPAADPKSDPATEPAKSPAVEPAAAPQNEFDLDNLPDHPKVLMKTTLGDILIELDNVKAPISTRNFIDYVQSGFYDGTIFHRVMDSFMIQGGGYTESVYQNSRASKKTTGKTIQNEAKNGLSNLRGTISMARTRAPHSASCQFFINVVDNQNLNYRSESSYGYAVFGKVIEGLDVVDKIRFTPVKSAGPHQTLPVTKIKIESVTSVME